MGENHRRPNPQSLRRVRGSVPMPGKCSQVLPASKKRTHLSPASRMSGYSSSKSEKIWIAPPIGYFFVSEAGGCPAGCASAGCAGRCSAGAPAPAAPPAPGALGSVGADGCAFWATEPDRDEL